MKRLLLCLLILATTPALAQEKAITWTVTSAEAQTILNAVSALPWRDANSIMQKLIAQANAQLTPPAAPPSPIPPPAPAPSPPTPPANPPSGE